MGRIYLRQLGKEYAHAYPETAKLLAENGRNILEGGDLDRHGGAKHDFGGVDGSGIARVCDGKPKVALRTFEGKDGGVAQEARRKAGGQRRRGDELRQSEPFQAIKMGHLIGEPICREFRRFPKLAKGSIRAGVVRGNRLKFTGRKQIFVCQIFCEVFNGNLIHSRISRPMKPFTIIHAGIPDVHSRPGETLNPSM